MKIDTTINQYVYFPVRDAIGTSNHLWVRLLHRIKLPIENPIHNINSMIIENTWKCLNTPKS